MRVSRLTLRNACFALIWSATVLAAPVAYPPTPTFYVSPRGNDSSSGKLAEPKGDDGPFATVHRARDAVRKLRKQQPESRGVRVVLRAGTYFLDSPLELGPEDSGAEGSPVLYAAAPGERVLLSGGRRLPEGRWGEANGHKAWIVNLPEVKEGKWRFRQLFVNDSRRPRTRLPREGEYHIEAMLPTLQLLDLTPYGRQETWEDSPVGWPQDKAGSWWRRDGRPVAQWTRTNVEVK